MESNLGFAGGMNAGVRWALDRGARAVAVVNNDVICPPGTVGRLMRLARADTAVSPEVRYLSDESRIWFGAGVVDWEENWPRHLRPEELPLPAPDSDCVRASEILAGCFILASATVWKRVGLFDERFFLIFEDSDWSVRARRQGIRLLVDTSSRISHRVSASFSGAGAYLGSYYYMRNGLLFGRLWGAQPLAGWRFLRRHILPHLAPPLHARDVRALAREGAIMAWAVLAFLAGKYGRAPRLLERLAKRWSGVDDKNYSGIDG
jgi:GT2 family glycosyltransferase